MFLSEKAFLGKPLPDPVTDLADYFPQVLRLIPIIMGCAFDTHEFPIRRCGRRQDTLHVTWRYGIVGRVFNEQDRDRNLRHAVLGIGAGVIDTPLGEPGPEGRETGESDGSGIDGFRIAQITAVGLPVTRVQRGIEKAGVGHCPVHDEWAFDFVCAPSFQSFKLFQGALGYAPDTIELALK